MCHEFWREQQRRTQDEQARKRVAEIIEKAKARPAPKTIRRPMTETDKETVPV